MRIRKFKQYLESISGTELIRSLGPTIGSQKLPNTITSKDTSVIASDIDGKIYTWNDHNDMYDDYLKKEENHLKVALLKKILKLFYL
jgi:hypothetical protein